MRRVLVLSDNPSFALAAMRTLGRGGHSCLLGSSAPARHPARSRYCAGYLSLPRLGVPGAAADAALARRLGDWARARGATVVLPLTPPETTLVAAHPAAFAGMAVPPLPSAEAMGIALDKRRFWETCEAMGIPVPVTHPVASRREAAVIIRAAGRPMVLKPVDFGPKLIVADPADLPSPMRPSLLQELVVGQDVDVSAVAVQGRTLRSYANVNLRHHESLDGRPVAVRCVEDADAVALAARLLDGLRWSGLAHVDMRRETRSGRLVAFELNPRLWASHLFGTLAGGLDPVDGLLRLALGRDLGQSTAADTRTTYVFPRTYLAGARLRHLGDLARMRPLRLHPTVALQDPTDPLPLVVRALSAPARRLAERRRVRLKSCEGHVYSVDSAINRRYTAYMITRVPIHQHERQRPPRRESERDLLLRLAREHRREERRARRGSAFRRLTGRARPADQ